MVYNIDTWKRTEVVVPGRTRNAFVEQSAQEFESLRFRQIYKKALFIRAFLFDSVSLKTHKTFNQDSLTTHHHFECPLLLQLYFHYAFHFR